MNDLTNQEYDILFKILLIGDSNVGKSSIILRYTENTFNEKLINSIGVDFKSKKITIEDKIVKLQIWDTAGHERFRSLTTSYYRGAHAIVVVFSITDRESFDHVEEWLQQVDNHATEKVIVFLVGNKCDLKLERVVQREEAEKLGKKHSIKYLETSCKDEINTNEVFENTIKEYIRTGKGNEITKGKTVSLGIDGIKEDKGCCS